MMPDLFAHRDRLTPLQEAAAAFSDLLPVRKAGKPITARTFLNWSRKGVAGVRLEIAYIGSTACTRRSWLERFITELTTKRGAA